MLYRYWTIQALGVALVALALAELWFLRLKEDDIEPFSVHVPDIYKRHIPVLVPDDTSAVAEAERVVRSGS